MSDVILFFNMDFIQQQMLLFLIFQTSKYDYNVGIRQFAELTAKEIEELRQKNIKELDVTNYDSPYAMGFRCYNIGEEYKSKYRVFRINFKRIERK